MDHAASQDEEKRLALVNARLDAKLKEAELAEKTKPWRGASPTTLMAMLAALTTVTAGSVSLFQIVEQQRGAKEAREHADMAAERVLVQNIMQQSGSNPEDVRNKLTALAIAGLLPTTTNGLIAAGLIDPAKLPSPANRATTE
jgi:hypothetical protein